MIDFHSHILPKMDDGSKSVEESLEMLRLLSSQGVKRVVATPHFYANDESVDEFLKRRSESYETLKPMLDSNCPEILLGAEVKYYNGISRMEGLRRLTVENSRLLLLEMSVAKWTDYVTNEIISLANSGDLIVALAHVERYFFMQSASIQERLLQNDVLMQCNAEFFNGVFSKYKALKLFGNGNVHLLGSDCHNTTDRKPAIDLAARKIVSKYGRSMFQQFVEFENSLLV